MAKTNGAEVGIVSPIHVCNKAAVTNLRVRGNILALGAPACRRVPFPLAVSGGAEWLLIVSLGLRPNASIDSVQPVGGVGSNVVFDVRTTDESL